VGEPGPPEPSVSDADKLSLFISYARTDASDFAEYLVVALKLAGFNAYLDRHDIAKGEDWEARLGDLIAKSDTVIFVITPESIRSKRCDWEVKRTLSLGKRLVPVQWIGVPEVEIPVELKRLNYTIFATGQQFSGPMAELAEALQQDLGWLRQQTELAEHAARWDARNRDSDLLLRGSALADARNWRLRRKSIAPEISAIVNVFIGVSEEFETAQQNDARKRLEEREKLAAEVEQHQKAREEALKEAEEANAQKVEASRRLVRRTVAGIVVAILLVLVAIAMSIFARQQRELANRQRELANEETMRADQFVNLVSSNPAGRRAMKKICLEAIEVTAMLATTPDQQQNTRAEERFWELYYAQMYIIELHQTKNIGRNPIEKAMIEFGDDLKSAQQNDAPLPYSSLCKRAKVVRQECIKYLDITAGEACP
jgi:TIR domain-containing protein